MKLKVLGSSSKGNCYILEGERCKLILEAGIKFDEVKKGLDFKLDAVVGCLVTHEHKDHAKHINSFLVNSIAIYTSKGTIGDLAHYNINLIESKQSFNLGEFKILPFDSIHDGKEPLNFLIESVITGEKLLFITDSAYCKYKFVNIDYLLVECNFKDSILQENIESGIVNEYLAYRIRNTHMELAISIELAKKYNSLKKIILIHLSEKNSDPKLFLEEFKNLVGIETHVAEAGVEFAL